VAQVAANSNSAWHSLFCRSEGQVGEDANLDDPSLQRRVHAWIDDKYPDESLNPDQAEAASDARAYWEHVAGALAAPQEGD
jgi:hypothetical protein